MKVCHLASVASRSALASAATRPHLAHYALLARTRAYSTRRVVQGTQKVAKAPPPRTQRDRQGSRVGSQEHAPDTFRQAGLQQQLENAIRRGGTYIRDLTPNQVQFISAINSGRDVLLRDPTGTGKSYGLVLALLNKAYASKSQRRLGNTAHPLTLVIVPHRELAFQMLHWIEQIHVNMGTATPLEDIARVAIRGSSTPLESLTKELRVRPPRILIGTPQALLEVHAAALDPDSIDTIVVDEADYLFDVPSERVRKGHSDKAWANFKRHPSPTRSLLSAILPSRKAGALSLEEQSSFRNDGIKPEPRPAKGKIQVVLSTATSHSYLERYASWMSGWIGDNFYKSQYAPKSSTPESAPSSYKVEYHAIVVSPDGRVENLEKSKSRKEGNERSEPKQEQSLSSEKRRALTKSDLAEDADDWRSKHMLDATLLEVVATLFAVDVPEVALLVLQPQAPVDLAVEDLRGLGVNAYPFGLQEDDAARSFLSGVKEGNRQEPALLVASPACIRGIDLPELSHVFLLGVPDVGNPDVFTHIAGRVNRFGKGGKVVSLLREREERVREDGVMAAYNQPNLMRLIYRRLGIRPVDFNLNVIS